MAPIARLFRYAAPQRLSIVLASIYSALNKLFDILPEVLIGIAVDVVVRKEESFIAMLGFPNVVTQLTLLGILTFVVWGLESLFQYLYSIKWRNLAQELQHRLRLDTYSHVQKLDMAFFENESTGNLLAIINDDVNQLERFLDYGANKIIQLVVSTVLVGIIFFYLAPLIAVFALAPVPIILLGAFGFQKALGTRYLSVREMAGNIGARLNNNITGIATIKSFTAEDFETDRLSHDSRAYQQANTKAISLSSAFIPIIRMAIAAGFITTTVLGGWYALEGHLAVGAYSVLVFLTQRMLWPFTELAELSDQYQRAMASTWRILNLLNTKVGITHGLKSLDRARLKGSVSFENVSFSYPNGMNVLHNFSYRIPAGHTVAFVGATGSGKSTLVKLILRFYEPSSGRILLDGEPIEDLNLLSLRRSIGFVSQDVFLFQGTVRENISYGSADASIEAIIDAAKIAEAHEFIEKLPNGYDTIVGERGQKLSGGQRQRLSIARAILKNPPILILDEATSAVDNETEEAIQRSLQKIVIGRTSIVIAHRLSTIRHANRIVVMDKGHIAESGTHGELLANQGLYARLWRIQTGGHIKIGE